MEEEKKPQKEKQPQNIVYALADYKQLVLQYRTKHAELVKALSFWKTTCVWLACAAAACAFFALSSFVESRVQQDANRQSMARVSAQLQQLSQQFDSWQQELKTVREELDRKNAQVSQLEKNLSTVQKKQVEKLLKDSQPKDPQKDPQPK